MSQSGKRPAGRKKVGRQENHPFHSTLPVSYNTDLKMPSTYKREKPWDTDDIDKWKVRLQHKDFFQVSNDFFFLAFANPQICDNRRKHSKLMTTLVEVLQRNRLLLHFSPNIVKST